MFELGRVRVMSDSSSDTTRPTDLDLDAIADFMERGVPLLPQDVAILWAELLRVREHETHLRDAEWLTHVMTTALLEDDLAEDGDTLTGDAMYTVKILASAVSRAVLELGTPTSDTEKEQTP